MAVVANEGAFVAYYRVSTERQGESGLGLAAQREAVSRFLGSSRGFTSLLAEFTEVESGKRHTNRPELLRAIELSRRQKATLVIAKLDRLARNACPLVGFRSFEAIITSASRWIPFGGDS